MGVDNRAGGVLIGVLAVAPEDLVGVLYVDWLG